MNPNRVLSVQLVMFRPKPSPTNPEGRRNQDAPTSGRISRIAPQKHDPERVSIFLDGQFAFGLNADLLLEAGLVVGQELSDGDVLDLVARDEVRQATSAALQFLGYRARSEGEIATRLRQRGYSQPAIEATLTKLRDWHYVDDQDFADRWIENRLQHRPRSARLLKQELRQRGVDADVAEQAIQDADVDEASGAVDIARERARRLSGLDRETRDRRIAALLGRRGYGWEVIRKAIAALDEVAESEG